METIVVDGPVIIGSGLAGLLTAACLAPAPCTVLTAAGLGDSTSTALAQGGLAAAIGPDDDPARHAADTHAAGAGLCDTTAVQAITAAGPATVERLARLGVRFDHAPDGRYALGLEGAHSRRRVLHAGGDASGAELLRAAAAAVLRSPSATLRPATRALRVLVEDGAVVGVLAEQSGHRLVLATAHVVLATGGIGGLFGHTTNPLTSRGQGLALAARAGASLRDAEMIQFHPTALDIGRDPMPLLSEAVRGEGARLVTEDGREFVDPLAARDVVARAVWAQRLAGQRTFLDARHLDMAARFPGIALTCADAGLDPARDLLPTRPAAHYHMGGILAGLDGETEIPGLFALGECASTGLHGANRLASNSLLEAAVCARLAAQTLAGTCDRPRPLAADRAARVTPCETAPAPLPLRELMERHAGVTRTEDGLAGLIDALAPWLDHDDALTAWLIATAALNRCESRGGHHRADHPAPGPGAEHTITHAPLPAPLLEAAR